MKAITLYNPHAVLMASFEKRIETRPRRWKYCGPVAIHSGLSGACDYLSDEEPFKSVLAKCGYPHWSCMPFGCVLAVGQMIGSVESEYLQTVETEERPRAYTNGGMLDIPYHFTAQEQAFGNYNPGRFCYIFSSMRRLREPIPAKGHQGIWEWEPPANLEELYV